MFSNSMFNRLTFFWFPSIFINGFLPMCCFQKSDHKQFKPACRKLEDKLLAVKVELRAWTLNLNLENLHQNRELPAGFVCFLGILDSCLPTKGTAHRNVRGNPDIDKKDINVFFG